MPDLAWYVNRLRAMERGELSRHLRRKLWQLRTSEALNPDKPLAANPHSHPRPPKPGAAPEALRQQLCTEAAEILAGRWTLFGGMRLQVDDPPRWQRDYLAGIDVTTDRRARELNHRELPHGADIKFIWELSRWNQLVRLAQAAHVLGDDRAARKCLDWLADWVERNPPFRGWNWTSALESGLRLIQFSWIDALLSGTPGLNAELERLRGAILPAHVQFSWHCRTFGSSANNHLLGELAGLIVAVARWPALESCSTTLELLHRDWEREVLLQFWDDGGNKEQALHYHLFSWELSWTARLALMMAGRAISEAVEERLDRAAAFYNHVQSPDDRWDYGDSDDAVVTPLFTSQQQAAVEWHAWMSGGPEKTAYEYWIGAPPRVNKSSQLLAGKHWTIHSDTGIATCHSGPWFLRWDVSPLGYLKPAAHGHIDALHLSIWHGNVAIVIDPGTGAYYGDPDLREWLASREAHNGPCAPSLGAPRRLGPFLWSHHHARPQWRSSERSIDAEVTVGTDTVKRLIGRPETGDGWQIIDDVRASDGSARPFTVYWQFAPGTEVTTVSERCFELRRREAQVIVDVDSSWTDIALVLSEADPTGVPGLCGLVSPSFRQTVFAPYLRLTAGCHDKPCVFRTTFLACEVR